MGPAVAAAVGHTQRAEGHGGAIQGPRAGAYAQGRASGGAGGDNGPGGGGRGGAGDAVVVAAALTDHFYPISLTFNCLN